MSNSRRLNGRKIQYPFIVRPLSEGWEVLFTATDWPYREAFFETRQAALVFAEIKNDYWKESREAMYGLIARLKESAEASCPSRPKQSQSLIGRFFSLFREQLLRVSART